MDALSREAAALLLLDRLPGVGPRTVRRLTERFGSGRRALEAGAEAFARVVGAEGRKAARARRDPELRATVVRGLRWARELGMGVRVWTDSGYPECLTHLADPPPVLFLRGDEGLLERPGVAVVGARRATHRGREVARRLGAGLASRGVTVVSGLALGVDGAAHAGALAAGGPTTAVLGGGADRASPRSHDALFRRILAEGLVVSEFLPGTPPRPHHFPRRNRIVAALAQAVVVVEAGDRSGALITVDHALDLGRDVWAVPGPIHTPSCAGTNQLLTEGARALVSVEAFVAEVTCGARGEASRDPEDRSPSGGPPSPDGVGSPSSVPAEAPVAHPALAAVLAVLAEGEQAVESVASRAGVTTAQALGILTRLELLGQVARLPGQRFRRAG